MNITQDLPKTTCSPPSQTANKAVQAEEVSSLEIHTNFARILSDLKIHEQFEETNLVSVKAGMSDSEKEKGQVERNDGIANNETDTSPPLESVSFFPEGNNDEKSAIFKGQETPLAQQDLDAVVTVTQDLKSPQFSMVADNALNSNADLGKDNDAPALRAQPDFINQRITGKIPNLETSSASNNITLPPEKQRAPILKVDFLATQNLRQNSQNPALLNVSPTLPKPQIPSSETKLVPAQDADISHLYRTMQHSQITVASASIESVRNVSKNQIDPISPPPQLVPIINQPSATVIAETLSAPIQKNRPVIPASPQTLNTEKAPVLVQSYTAIEPAERPEIEQIVSKQDEFSPFASPVNASHATLQNSQTAPAVNRFFTANTVDISDAIIKIHDQGGKIDVALTPEDLGRLTVKLDQTANGALVTLSADRFETQELMRRHIEVLQTHLKSMGYENLSFTFTRERQEHKHPETNTHEDNDADYLVETKLSKLTGIRQTFAHNGLDIRI